MSYNPQDGPKGDPGTAATITVGTVSTGAPGTSVSVTNSATPVAAKLDFTIPRGDVGSTGANGKDGTNGSAGPNTVTTATTTNITGLLYGGGVNVASATSANVQTAIGAGVYLPSATVLPVTKAAVAGSVLLSYDSSTGAFTQGAVAGLGSNTFTAIQTMQKGFAESVSSSTAPASGATLSLTTPVQLVAPTGAITGVIMPVGTVAGQTQTVINNSAFSITFAAVATSHVSDGTSDVIAANTSRCYIWSGSVWFPQK